MLPVLDCMLVEVFSRGVGTSFVSPGNLTAPRRFLCGALVRTRRDEKGLVGLFQTCFCDLK
jgi:hypothetical protein